MKGAWIPHCRPQNQLVQSPEPEGCRVHQLDLLMNSIYTGAKHTCKPVAMITSNTVRVPVVNEKSLAFRRVPD